MNEKVIFFGTFLGYLGHNSLLQTLSVLKSQIFALQKKFQRSVILELMFQ